MTYDIKLKYKNTSLNGNATIEIKGSKMPLKDLLQYLSEMIDKELPEQLGSGKINDDTFLSIAIKKNK